MFARQARPVVRGEIHRLAAKILDQERHPPERPARQTLRRSLAARHLPASAPPRSARGSAPPSPRGPDPAVPWASPRPSPPDAPGLWHRHRHIRRSSRSPFLCADACACRGAVSVRLRRLGVAKCWRECLVCSTPDVPGTSGPADLTLCGPLRGPARKLNGLPRVSPLTTRLPQPAPSAAMPLSPDRRSVSRFPPSPPHTSRPLA